jgi:hypothetical protein
VHIAQAPSRSGRLRKRLKSEEEIKALRKAVRSVVKDPKSGKKLKGELQEFRRVRYSVGGQQKRLVYKETADVLFLVSFGLRVVICKG